MASVRVAFVGLFTAAPPTGGAGRVTCALAAALPADCRLLQPGPAQRRFVTDAGLAVWQWPLASGSRWRKLLGIAGYVRQVEQALTAWGPDVVVLEGASWVVYHWWLMTRLRLRLPGVRLLYHAHNVEYDLRRQRHGWLTQRLTRWAEARVLTGCWQVFAVSAVDQARFHSLYGSNPLLLPNGVDTQRFVGVPAARASALQAAHQLGDAAVLFLGDYAYPPNREAIDLLVTAVMPLVLAQCPQARLAIIGGPVPWQRPWLRAPGLLADADVPGFIRACAVSVAPIFSGSGTRLKILESLAAGVPVVASVKGAEGLGLVADTELLLATTASEFASALVGLLRDPQRRARLGEAGQRRVARCYDWSVLVPALTAMLPAAPDDPC